MKNSDAHASYDAIVLGAGAAGLFCAAEAGRRGAKVLVVDHAKKLGEKIRISGGGRCNFTNLNTAPRNFVSNNPKFCISALSRYTPENFLALLEGHKIAWHEKTLGQLFCDGSAVQITQMLLAECERAGVEVRSACPVSAIEHGDMQFRVKIEQGIVQAQSLVVATGGKSIPKIGATGFGFDLAGQFDIPVIEPRPGLVPLTFDGPVHDLMKSLAGVSINAVTRHGATYFYDGMVFTHRGLSGPTILQITNFWRDGEPIEIDLLPDHQMSERLVGDHAGDGRRDMMAMLGEAMPKRLAASLCDFHGWHGRLAERSKKDRIKIADNIHRWQLMPAGSEGYRTAEVTVGGVDTKHLDGKTMMARAVPGLFFIGEVVDVTGWLGGYNFQWAWASGHAAGLALAERSG